MYKGLLIYSLHKTRDARKLGQDAKQELRHRAVALKERHDDIADILEVSRGAVRKWWGIYKKGGKRALCLGQRGRTKGHTRQVKA